MSFNGLIARGAGLFLAALIATGCSDGDTDPLADLLVISDKDITSIVIVPDKTTIEVSEILQLQATNGVGGADITAELRWASINPGVARITGAGAVEGIADGVATITAQIGDIEDSTEIIVSSAAVVSVQIEPALPAYACANTQFTATAVFMDGREDDRTSTAEWRSSDPALADFLDADPGGLLRTFGAGNVTITATVEPVTSADYSLDIGDITAIEIDAVDGNTTVEIGATEQLIATGSYADNLTRDVSGNVTWSSASPSVASIEETTGLLTGEDSGMAEISANCDGLEGTRDFTVGTGEASLVRLSLAWEDGMEPASIGILSERQLKADGIFSDDSTQDVTEQAEWSVTSGSLSASVSNDAGSKGLVSSTAFPGLAVVKATYEGVEETFNVDVEATR